MDPIETKLESLGLRLPTNRPERKFVPAKQVGDLVFLSGHGPRDENNALPWVGRVGRDITVDEGYQAARLVAVNCLGALKELLGSLERVEEIVKVLGFVNSADDFHDQPAVMHGFTDLMLELFGERGVHARSAIGTSNLPGNQPVEVEMIVRVRP